MTMFLNRNGPLAMATPNPCLPNLSLPRLNGSGGVTKVALVAIALSHLTHYLSVLALYRLSINVFDHGNTSGKLTSFLSSSLHIICPAGAFLSAPYGESLFSFLNITGFYIYSSSLLDLKSGMWDFYGTGRLRIYLFS
ncbi:hypothetical protein BDV23DRAFT_61094 [Aspergillus alliaceus]|uniref:GPI mannosyltransferase 2 n=1 Tax=Petromyces alliaceus TaxID=209559 RepID=A0A5N7CDU8_PETAA|nr:hypothetical protein BDV23DRAFT_61094 [Aspergillus alliaceus]